MSDETMRQLTMLGITLPESPPAVGNYVPYCRTGTLVFVSGQLPLVKGSLIHTGRLGEEVDIEAGQAAARQCAINIIAQLSAATEGNLDRITGIIRLGGFVNCAADFFDHPTVINGASDLMVAVFGQRGQHARFAVGAPSLPLNAPVEIEAVAALAD